MTTTAPPRPTTSTGAVCRSPWVPLPSWPTLLKPQHFTPPPSRITQVWLPPAEMSTMGAGPGPSSSSPSSSPSRSGPSSVVSGPASSSVPSSVGGVSGGVSGASSGTPSKPSASGWSASPPPSSVGDDGSLTHETRASASAAAQSAMGMLRIDITSSPSARSVAPGWEAVEDYRKRNSPSVPAPSRLRRNLPSPPRRNAAPARPPSRRPARPGADHRLVEVLSAVCHNIKSTNRPDGDQRSDDVGMRRSYSTGPPLTNTIHSAVGS